MRHHTKSKGNIATSKVMLDLMVKGCEVLTPFSDYLPFDLVAYQGGRFLRLQVKYSNDGYVSGRTSWTDKNGSHHRKYVADMFDYYALYLPSVDVVIYPAFHFAFCQIATEPRRSARPFYWYEDFLDFTDSATKRTFRDFGLSLAGRPGKHKVERPSREELKVLLWREPTVNIARRLGVSGKAIEKWAKEYGLTKPSRGYWTKCESLECGG